MNIENEIDASLILFLCTCFVFIITCIINHIQDYAFVMQHLSINIAFICWKTYLCLYLSFMHKKKTCSHYFWIIIAAIWLRLGCFVVNKHHKDYVYGAFDRCFILIWRVNHMVKSFSLIWVWNAIYLWHCDPYVLLRAFAKSQPFVFLCLSK